MSDRPVFELTLSPEGAEIKIGVDQKGVEVFKELRTVEKEVLQDLFDAVAANSKKISEINCAMDVWAQVDGLKPGETLKLTRGDLDMLKHAVELTAGRRSIVCNRCVNLFRQIENAKL